MMKFFERKLANMSEINDICRCLPFLRNIDFKSLDKYTGYEDIHNLKKTDIIPLFSTTHKEIVSKTDKKLWEAVEFRNEMELVKLAMNEFEDLQHLMENYKDADIDTLCNQIFQYCSKNAQYINYVFLNCACLTLSKEPANEKNKISSKDVIKRFLIVTDSKSEQCLFYYLSFILTKENFNKLNGMHCYTTTSTIGNILDKNNKKSRLVRILADLNRHPFDDDPYYIPSESKSAEGIKLNSLVKGENKSIILDLVKATNRDEIDDIIEAAISRGDITKIQSNKLKVQADELRKNLTSTPFCSPLKLISKSIHANAHNAIGSARREIVKNEKDAKLSKEASIINYLKQSDRLSGEELVNACIEAEGLFNKLKDILKKEQSTNKRFEKLVRFIYYSLKFPGASLTSLVAVTNNSKPHNPIRDVAIYGFYKNMELSQTFIDIQKLQDIKSTEKGQILFDNFENYLKNLVGKIDDVNLKNTINYRWGLYLDEKGNIAITNNMERSIISSNNYATSRNVEPKINYDKIFESIYNC